MLSHETIIGELLDMGLEVNPIRPDAACLFDSDGAPLVTACSAVHLSPLFTAEGLVLHLYSQNFLSQEPSSLTLCTTSECDPAAMATICQARSQGINIDRIIFGAPTTDINIIWMDQANIDSREILSSYPADIDIEIIGPIAREQCLEAFRVGKNLLDETLAPSLSLDIEEYYFLGDWDDDELFSEYDAP